jgi:hypothetical protein
MSKRELDPSPIKLAEKSKKKPLNIPLPDPEREPDSQVKREQTFLTSMLVDSEALFQSNAQNLDLNSPIRSTIEEEQIDHRESLRSSIRDNTTPI